MTFGDPPNQTSPDIVVDPVDTFYPSVSVAGLQGGRGLTGDYPTLQKECLALAMAECANKLSAWRALQTGPALAAALEIYWRWAVYDLALALMLERRPNVVMLRSEMADMEALNRGPDNWRNAAWRWLRHISPDVTGGRLMSAVV